MTPPAHSAARSATRSTIPLTVELGRSVIQQEAAALLQLEELLDESFAQAVELIHACRGNVIVSGMGKAGLIGQKIAATLASTGTRSHFLHPAEAIHGDLGRVHADDVVLLLSQSGTTEEVLRLLPSLQCWHVPIIVITGQAASPLAQAARVTLCIGPVQEACPLGLAPSASTTAMLALGDALALAVSHRRGFTAADFARFHPGGALGRKLARVEDHMRPIDQCRVTSIDMPLRQSLVELSQPGRRSGAILITDSTGRLAGIFTDSDLAKLLESQRDELLDHPIGRVMTSSPTTVPVGTMMSTVIAILRDRKFSELPVVDVQQKPLGIIDVTDVVGFLPDQQLTSRTRAEFPPRSDLRVG